VYFQISTARQCHLMSNDLAVLGLEVRSEKEPQEMVMLLRRVSWILNNDIALVVCLMNNESSWDVILS
jgi:hypothetical protein